MIALVEISQTPGSLVSRRHASRAWCQVLVLLVDIAKVPRRPAICVMIVSAHCGRGPTDLIALILSQRSNAAGPPRPAAGDVADDDCEGVDGIAGSGPRVSSQFTLIWPVTAASAMRCRCSGQNYRSAGDNRTRPTARTYRNRGSRSPPGTRSCSRTPRRAARPDPTYGPPRLQVVFVR